MAEKTLLFSGTGTIDRDSRKTVVSFDPKIPTSKPLKIYVKRRVKYMFDCCRLGYFKREQLVDDIPKVAKEEVDREDSVQLECRRRSFIQWQRS